jgi:hypothetical protein
MMEIGDYWAALVRGWWLIAIFGLAGLAVPLLLASPPKGHVSIYYQSRSSVGSPPTAPGSPIGGGISTGQILYYASTDAVMAETSRLSGLNLSLPEARSLIALTVPGGNSGQGSSTSGGVVDVTATGATAADALALDNGFVDAMNDYTNSTATNGQTAQEQKTESTLNTVLTDIATNHFVPGLNAQALEVQVSALQSYLASLVVEQPGSGFQTVQAPSAQSTTPVVTGTPTIVQNKTLRAAVGLLIGLIVGALAAVALWLMDRRLKTAKRAQLALGYPVVAKIPFETSDSTEAYRMLWLSVFREPLPLPPADQDQRFYEGEDPVLDRGAGSGSGQPRRT